MVTDKQVRLLMKRLAQRKPLYRAAVQAGMDEKTARKYRDCGRLPEQCRSEHTWRTRRDPFAAAWDEVRMYLERDHGLQAKTLFEALQRQCPGRFADGQLRTLQRRIRRWRATAGPPKEVFFEQEHKPGVLCESDFTAMNELRVTLAGQPFEHLLYHFVLTYSNWETGTVCFAESLESLSTGLQNALHELGGVPRSHRSDRMSAAVNNQCVPEEFTRRYQALLAYYGLEGQKIQTGKANENGDIEQRHYRFKQALDQELLLRGSRDFASRADYEHFLRALFRRLNAGRKARLAAELRLLRRLPRRRLDDCKRVAATVSEGSTIRVQHNTYSVHSRLIGSEVEARVYAEHIEVWYAQQQVERLPRLQGRYRCRINYRHVIDWLVRKPGAFENYRYRDELFPTSIFRTAYDLFKQRHAPSAAREYLRVLELAAREGETLVEGLIRQLLGREQPVSFEVLEHLVLLGQQPPPPTQVEVAAVNLSVYDALCPVAAGEVADG
jgi:hypothetical protein